MSLWAAGATRSRKRRKKYVIVKKGINCKRLLYNRSVEIAVREYVIIPVY